MSSLSRHPEVRGKRASKDARPGPSPFEARLRYAGSLAAMLPWLQDEIEEIDEVFGGDPFPYGIEPNRPTLQALVQYMVEQHFIAKAMPIEELFVPLHGETLS